MKVHTHVIPKIQSLFSKIRPPSLNASVETMVYKSLVDQAFDNMLITLIPIGVGLLVYSTLLFYKHDWKLHLWILIFLLVYFFRLLFYFIFYKLKFLSNKWKETRYSSVTIIFWGSLSALLWVFLLFIVINGYPLQSQIFSIWVIIFFSSGAQTRYSLIPLWYLSYVTAMGVPVCLWLFFQGNEFILISLGALFYIIYTLSIVYSYFDLHFESVLLHIKNTELLIEVKNNAAHDMLTGLANRSLLQDRINQHILSSKRVRDYWGVLFIDLDRFKVINDTFGHEMGDKVLKAVAERLKSELREGDTVSRLGGDEFVVLISHLKHVKAIYHIAQKLTKALSQPYALEEHFFNCPTSVGIAMYPKGGKTFEELIKNADMAMYKAKKKGGDCFVAYGMD